MICKFCENILKLDFNNPGNGKLDLFSCRNCLRPKHNTLYRQLYRYGEILLLSDSIKIDEFYVHRNFEDNYSILYRGIIGTVDSNYDMTPITFNEPVCKVDGIIDMPCHDIDLLKYKLNTYTVFS